MGKCKDVMLTFKLIVHVQCICKKKCFTYFLTVDECFSAHLHLAVAQIPNEEKVWLGMKSGGFPAVFHDV